MKHVVMYSGGIGSYMAAKRVAQKENIRDIILLFSDTLTEDEDLYRFIDQTIKEIGATFVRLCEGRDVWQVFKDVKYLGNSRIAPCTRVLKQEIARQWIISNFQPEEVKLYVGIDWMEIHRLEKIKKNWLPYKIKAPLCESPYYSKLEMFDELNRDGITVPRLYKFGFSHNNCGGFCVKAGQAHFKKLYDTMPERFLYHEEMEQEMIKFLGKEVSILRRQKNNRSYGLTLRKLREEIEEESKEIDLFDFGGCGCFIEESKITYKIS
ncbi:hypothetical protein HHO41_18640 [Bacillus sp. DNRA2]|uniref:hypothetical protein n=1 Tax=Bacillus sp. DNRA2 TaxID=2723053 RepID=UPI00145E6561|nr:hypothetical protein [Bacillus sp. DNRA2]NMD72290.1 hypothetical protein [Bacillus sp. DNRA2]